MLQRDVLSSEFKIALYKALFVLDHGWLAPKLAVSARISMARNKYAHDNHRHEPKYHETSCKRRDGDGGVARGVISRTIDVIVTAIYVTTRGRIVSVRAVIVVISVERAAKGEYEAINPNNKEQYFHGEDSPVAVSSWGNVGSHGDPYQGD